ncbi:MAG: Uma2 family endonuclease [Cyanophyceae cyanobacterium]
MICLGVLLAETECELHSGGLRVWIEGYTRGTYSDAMVVKGELEFNGDRTDEVVNPYLIVDVLSLSTKDCDRGSKFQCYRACPVFVSIY